MKSTIQSRCEEFKTKLEELRNGRKKEIIERLDARISQVNTNRMVKISDSLDRLQTILNSVSSKSATLTSTDKTLLTQAIADAQEALDEAQTAVDTQAEKDYVFTITDDSQLRVSIGTTVSQFTRDMRDTHKKVVEAKQAVKKTAMYYNRLKNGEKEATDSAE